MTDTSQPFVRVCGISYTHWNHTDPSLIDISFNLYPGTLNILVGPGGSGKTTLCDVLNGKIPHLLGGDLLGDVWVGDMNTRQTEVKDLARQVGYVFQDPETMFATLYVEDEIAFGPENLRFEVDDIKKEVDRLLDLTQLTPFRRNLVWNLSGGQVQKLGLAVALSARPRLIILDEPTSNLDPAATFAVHELIQTLRDSGMTVLLITRELDETLAKADQLIVLDKGHLLAAGSPRQVLRDHGIYMSEKLGVWLPETVEIGIALQEHQYELEQIPITIKETFETLNGLELLKDGLTSELVETQHERGEKLVSARDLVYSYTGEQYALQGVSLDIYAGEMLAIAGRNGAGKSTLAKLFSGLLKPQKGSLDLFGKPASKWKVQDLATNLALVFQNPEHQFLTDTVHDEVAYSLLARGLNNQQEIEDEIRKTLDQLGLTEYEKIHPFALSAGMKRRLGVATMLVGNPRLLLVDEPTYGQDRQMTETLMALMEDIRSRGIAVVMITHDMRLVQEYADRVVVMSDGKVLFDGEHCGLFEQAGLLEAANLRPTLLNELVNYASNRGVSVQGRYNKTRDFLNALHLTERMAS